MEMVFRGLYHYAQALLRGTHQPLVPFLILAGDNPAKRLAA